MGRARAIMQPPRAICLYILRTKYRIGYLCDVFYAPNFFQKETLYYLLAKGPVHCNGRKKFIMSNGHDHISLYHRDTISLSISRNHEHFEIMNNLLNSCTYLKSQKTYYYKFMNIFYNQEHFFNLWTFFAIYKHFLKIVHIFKQFS